MLSPKKFLLIATIILVGLGFFFLRPNRKRKPPNIILIVLDTLRPDHLGCYGYRRSTSPFIDSLAAGGCIFKQAYTPMPSTVPSHASMFTSYFPGQLNVLKNGHRLADNFLTAAEIFKQSGYNTAGIISIKHLFKHANLDQGFDYFQLPELDRDVLYRPADQVVNSAITWLKDVPPENPFFLWLHFYDCHGPYVPPSPYLEKFSDQTGSERSNFIEYLKEAQHMEPKFYADLPLQLVRETIDLNRYKQKEVSGTETLLRFINAYDGEVRFLDTELSRLYQYFGKKGINRNTLWLILSDHGEGLSNHNWLEHEKYLYNEQIRVALIFHSPELIPKGIVSNQIVNVVDILPTLVDLVGISTENITDSESWAGVSLVPLLFPPGKEKIADPIRNRYAFAQRRYYAEVDPDDVISPDEGYAGETYSLQNNRYKYILHTVKEDELYNLRKDPGELENILGEGGEGLLLKTELIDRIESLKSIRLGPPELIGRQGVEKLKALGYTQ